MHSATVLKLYTHLSQNGPKGLLDISDTLYDGDIITARQDLRYLESEDLIEQTPAVTGFSGSGQKPRKWKVIDVR